MNNCINHPDRKAISLCHGCGKVFCESCLDEGKEYLFEAAEKVAHNDPVSSVILPPSLTTCSCAYLKASTADLSTNGPTTVFASKE